MKNDHYAKCLGILFRVTRKAVRPKGLVRAVFSTTDAPHEGRSKAACAELEPGHRT